MAERNFGKKEARRENFRTLVNWAGKFIKGEAVVVPVLRSDYGQHIDPLVKATNDSWDISEFTVRKALRGEQLTMDEAEAMGKVPARRPDNLAIRWRGWPARAIVGLMGHVASGLEAVGNVLEAPDFVGMRESEHVPSPETALTSTAHTD